MQRVLVIDDERAICDSLAGFLEDHDFDVLTAPSAEEALEIVRSTQLDAAIVDLRLPGMGGEAFIAQAHGLRPGLRFLIHTGAVSYRFSSALQTIGMAPGDVFLKPQHDLGVFVEALDRLLGTPDASSNR